MIYRTTKPHETPDSDARNSQTVFASNAFVSQASLDPCTTVKLRLTTAHLIDDYKSSMSDIQWLYKLHKLEVTIFLIQNWAAKTGGFNRFNQLGSATFPWTPWWAEVLWRMAFQLQPGSAFGDRWELLELVEKWDEKWWKLMVERKLWLVTGDWWKYGVPIDPFGHLDVDSFGQFCAICRTQSIQFCAVPIRDHRNIRNQSPPVVNHRPLAPIEESRSENHASADSARGNLSTRITRDQIAAVNGKVTLNSFHIQQKTSEDSFRYATPLSQALWVNHILVDEPGSYLAQKHQNVELHWCTYIYICVYIYVYIYMYIYIYCTRMPGVPPRGLSWDQLFRICLGGFHLGLFEFLPCFWFYFQGLLWVGLARVLCFGNKSRQPSCHFTKIPTCKKHWPCRS